MQASGNHYCVYFDHRYAALGLTMLRSLRACEGHGTAWVICLSEEAEVVVAQFDVDNLRIVPLRAIEEHFPRLARAKLDRSGIEYYFTLTPHIIRYVFDHAPDARRVAYLDSDLFFFHTVEAVWRSAKDAPVAIIRHNFHRGAERLARYGEYNVGWVSFTRSVQGLACLDFWADSCAQWCRDVVDGDRFADQGYLSRFHEFAPDRIVIRHKGCNLGPWNIGRYNIRWMDGAVSVDQDRLIFFHFTGFKKGFAGRWFNSHRFYRTNTSNVVRDHVYRPYLAALLDAQKHIAPHLPDVPPSSQTVNLARNRAGKLPLRAAFNRIVRTAFSVWDLFVGAAIAEPRKRPDRDTSV